MTATTKKNAKIVEPGNKSSSANIKNGKIKPTRSTIFDQWSSYEVEPGVRASLLCKRNGGALLGHVAGCDTFLDTFKRGFSKSPYGNCLGWREGQAFRWWTYQDVYDRVRALAGALGRNTQLAPRKDCVGIYAGAKPDWVVSALAIASRSLFIVPLYETLCQENCNFIINQVEMTIIFVDTQAAAKQVIANSRHTPTLKTVVIFEQHGDELAKMASQNGVTLTTIDQFMSQTHDIFPEDAFVEPKADDICAIFYTSGTTGSPKGVIHTHESVVSDFTAIDNSLFLNDFGPGLRFSKDDVALQYLPLAHTYGLLVVNWLFYHGSSIGFFSGNIANLMEDAQILKPTFFPLVPRLMNRLYAKVVGEVQKSAVKSKLFWYAYRRKREMMMQGHITRDSLWDKWVFRKVQNLLGGRCWLMCVGSAPVSAEVVEFWRVVFGVLILEGYGQTETAAAATIAMGPVGGNVGHPISSNYIKLVDVPECDYYVKNGKGEVCIKGINVMKGYYKQWEKTAEVLDADGWLHTGDIGEFLSDGSLRIVDRKKNIFKLAQGEYIAPEKVENIYLLCPEVGQVFIEGSPLESFTVAIVVPDPSMAETFASRNGLDPKMVHLNEGYRKFLIHSLRGIGKANNLNSLEQVRSIYVTNQPFSIENGLLTPTMKNKRLELRRFFKEQIDAMYRAGPIIAFDAN